MASVRHDLARKGVEGVATGGFLVSLVATGGLREGLVATGDLRVGLVATVGLRLVAIEGVAPGADRALVAFDLVAALADFAAFAFATPSRPWQGA